MKNNYKVAAAKVLKRVEEILYRNGGQIMPKYNNENPLFISGQAVALMFLEEILGCELDLYLLTGRRDIN